MLQVAGDGYIKGTAAAVEGLDGLDELVSWLVSVTPPPVGCHYVTRVTSYEEDSTRKGGPLERAWHLLLGAAFGGETHHPWVYPTYGICIPTYVLD